MGESILTSSGFVLLATVVAFNTLIYVGLTAAKLIPWPKQFRPSQVLRQMDRFGLRIDEESAMREIPVPLPPESDDPVEELRLTIARQEIPQTFALAGGLVMLFSAAMAAFTTGIGFEVHVAEFLIGLALLVTGVVLWFSRARGRTMIRVFAVAAAVVILLLILEGFRFNAGEPLAYSLLVMTAFMPMGIGRRPTAIASAAILIGTTVIALVYEGLDGLIIVVLAASALLVGATLLRIRLRAITLLAQERAIAAELATSDPLTGMLTERGMLTIVPALAATAARTGHRVCVISLSVGELERAYREYGQPYGDEALRTVAGVVRSSVRTGDLVARLTDNELVVVGTDRAPDALAMRQRIESGLRAAGTDLGRWPLTVAVGTADGDPDSDTFEALLAVARARQVLTR